MAKRVVLMTILLSIVAGAMGGLSKSTADSMANLRSAHYPEDDVAKTGANNQAVQSMSLTALRDLYQLVNAANVQLLDWPSALDLLDRPRADVNDHATAMWSDWGTWSACKRLLCRGHAEQRRVRHCIQSQNRTDTPEFGADHCPGRAYRMRRCKQTDSGGFGKYMAAFGFNTSLPVAFTGRTVVFSCCAVRYGMVPLLTRNGQPIALESAQVSALYHISSHRLDIAMTNISFADTGVYGCLGSTTSQRLDVMDLDDVLTEAGDYSQYRQAEAQQYSGAASAHVAHDVQLTPLLTILLAVVIAIGQSAW